MSVLYSCNPVRSIDKNKLKSVSCKNKIRLAASFLRNYHLPDVQYDCFGKSNSLFFLSKLYKHQCSPPLSIKFEA